MIVNENIRYEICDSFYKKQYEIFREKYDASGVVCQPYLGMIESIILKFNIPSDIRTLIVSVLDVLVKDLNK